VVAFLAVPGFVLAACSSDPATVAPSNTDAGELDEDASVATEGGAVSVLGDACDRVKSPCTGGLKCVTISGTGGYCAPSCAKAADCPSSATCTLGACLPSCAAGVGCPSSRMVCRANVCLPSCAKDSEVCRATERCQTDPDGVSYCLSASDAGTDANVNTCQTPTTVASSGVTTTKTISALTDGEKGTLCDWLNGRYGGYGCKATCDGGLSYTNKKDQTACKATLKATCPATVAEAEECIRQDSADRCAGKLLTAPACAPMRQTGCP
jgi:hypothetical protein